MKKQKKIDLKIREILNEEYTNSVMKEHEEIRDKARKKYENPRGK